MIAPPLPRSLDELGAWGVYADWLLEHRPDDWRGPLIARELAMPVRPDRETLRRFQRSVRRLSHVHGLARRVATFGWCLAHLRSMHVSQNVGEWFVQRGIDAVEALLSSPDCAHLEEFTLDESPDEPRWAALLRALPSSCTRVVLRRVRRLDHALVGADALFDVLPRHVRVVAIEGSAYAPPLTNVDARLFDDRLDEIDLTRTMLSPAGRARVVGALRTTRRVRVRLGALDAEWPVEVRERLVSGRSGDCALRDDASGVMLVLPRLSLLAAQRAYGLVPAPMQIAGPVAARWELRVRDGIPGLWPPASLVVRREVDGAMSIRVGRRDALFERIAVAVNGRRLAPYERAVLSDGDRLRLEGREWIFVAALGTTNAWPRSG